MQSTNLLAFKNKLNKVEKIILLPLVLLILFYKKFIAFLLFPCCRFHPSCSSYSLQAIKEYGIFGLYYVFLRIIRCHPFCKGGLDLLPKNSKNNYE